MSELNRFENQLREALRRVEPPAGLEQRILARVEAKSGFARRRWLAVAASVLFVFGGGAYGLHYRQQREEERRVEIVRQQFTFALQVTSKHLSKAERQLRAIGVKQIELREVEQ
jgi:hypothetical protein